jgi:hypothetical protein
MPFHSGPIASLVLTALFAVSAAAAPFEANRVAEVALVSSSTYANPFLEVELDAIVTRPDGARLRVPGFWAGGNDWRFRYASDQLGTHTWQTECSDASNAGLHGVAGSIEVVASTSANPLFLHGPIRVAADHRHFEHADGTPFFWLGDTWWKGLCKRLTWEGFQQLTADRAAKGFNVVQIVCGTYPDEPGVMQPSWENEGGKPYEVINFSVMNPAYFTYADRRFEHLMEAGIVPAIVSGWGRAVGLNVVGIDGYKRHFRNLIARYGAYPVVWILGGETDSGQGPWYELAEYVSAIDPYQRILVNHSSHGRTALADHAAFDFDMLAVGHASWGTANSTIGQITSSRAQSPAKPVLNGEACYERHMELNFQDLQRHLFWGCLLSGAAGHTYGAAGIWHMGVEEDHGNWAVMIWQDNVITSPVIAANNAGTAYEITFDYGTGVYGQAAQATGAGDGLLVQVLRPDNSVLASDTYAPGAWGAGNRNLDAGLQGTLSYTGDGTGAVRLRIGPQGALTTGRFQGSIDNLLVREATEPAPGVLRIKEFDVNGAADEILISWESRLGLRYALLSDTDLSNPVATWPVYDGHENIDATPPENFLLLSPIPVDSRRFFSVRAQWPTE